jgi:excisionase family DNA binding protein
MRRLPVSLEHAPQRQKKPAGSAKHRLGYSVEEAAERLGIGRSSAYAAVRRGELPVIRFGRRLIVPVPALERLLAMLPTDADA